VLIVRQRGGSRSPWRAPCGERDAGNHEDVSPSSSNAAQRPTCSATRQCLDVLHDSTANALNSSHHPRSPSFTPREHTAARGDKEIHLRALQLVAPDGLLATYLLLASRERNFSGGDQ